MITQRLARVRAELQARNIDSLVLVPGANLTYLTDLSFMLLKRPILLSSPPTRVGRIFW